ncbi:hypothetical protein JCM21900_002346 [Sporobolomyces salmonicolor]
MAVMRERSPSSPPPDDPPEEESESDESSDGEPVEPNLATRQRRSNAGNRMQALLEDEAAAEVEEMFKEEENDDEFAQKEEEDVFDSDFGSTDEGSAGEDDDEEAGERRLQREAKEAKKAAKSKKKKGFVAPSHPFARTTKDQARRAAREAQQPVASTSATTLDEDGLPAVKRKKVSVDPAFLVPQRESTRRAAREFKKGVQERLEESEKKRATAPKPTKKAAVTLTQADLIAEALETEEVNRAALLAFYAAEEDRREAERIAGMRYEIIGPKLTFLSRCEGRPEKPKGKGKGKEGEEVQENKHESGRRRMIEVLGETGMKGWKGGVAASEATSPSVADSPAPLPPAPAPSVSESYSGTPFPCAPSSTSQINRPTSTQPDPSTPQPFARNYLIFDQCEGSTEAEELEALFGDHNDWSKAKPQAAATTCPITGLPARYRDPRTFTPYATLPAFRTLNSLVDAQSFVWSDALGAYTGTSGVGLTREVEAAWARRPQPKPRYAAAPPPPSAAVALPPAPTPVQPTRPALKPIKTGGSGSGSASGSANGKGKGRAPAQREDNPYKIEYAHTGGSGRGSRGRLSLSDLAGGSVSAPGTPTPAPAAAAGGLLHTLPPLPSPATLSSLPEPSSNGMNGTPLGASSASAPFIGASHTAPQARSIQLSSNGGGLFGGGPRSSPGGGSMFDAPAYARPSSPFHPQQHLHHQPPMLFGAQGGGVLPPLSPRGQAGSFSSPFPQPAGIDLPPYHPGHAQQQLVYQEGSPAGAKASRGAGKGTGALGENGHVNANGAGHADGADG